MPVDPNDPRESIDPVRWAMEKADVWLPGLLGIAGLIYLLRLAEQHPNPSPFQVRIYLVVLALSAAAFAALIPGLLKIKLSGPGVAIRAAGAIGIFALVFFYEPAQTALFKALNINISEVTSKKVASADVSLEVTGARWERTTHAIADRRVETSTDRICAQPQAGYEVDTTRPGFHGGLAVSSSTGDNYHREFWDGDCFVIYAATNGGRGSHADASGITVALKRLLPVGPCGSDVKKGVLLTYSGSNEVAMNLEKALGSCTGSDLPKPPEWLTNVLFYFADGTVAGSAAVTGLGTARALDGKAEVRMGTSGLVTIVLKDTTP